MKHQINVLLEEILKIPGHKIITLIQADQQLFVIDVDPDGQFGYDPTHKALLKCKLTSAMHEGGGMIIRQFLPIKIKRKRNVGAREKLIWCLLRSEYLARIRRRKC